MTKPSAITLFFSNVSPHVRMEELHASIRSELRDSFPKVSIRNSRIMRITNRESGQSEFHCLLDLQPAKAALCLIKNNAHPTNGDNGLGRLHRYQPRNSFRRDAPGAQEQARMDRQERRRGNLGYELIKPNAATAPHGKASWLGHFRLMRA